MRLLIQNVHITTAFSPFLLDSVQTSDKLAYDKSRREGEALDETANPLEAEAAPLGSSSGLQPADRCGRRITTATGASQSRGAPGELLPPSSHPCHTKSPRVISWPQKKQLAARVSACKLKSLVSMDPAGPQRHIPPAGTYHGSVSVNI